MLLKNLILLDLKKIFRSTHFERARNFKIFFIVLFFLLGFFLIQLGSNLYFVIERTFNQPPLDVINGFLLYWFFFDLVLRYFFQKLPFLRVQSLMVLPIKRNVITHYYLAKSLISKFNLFPFLIILPFSFSLLKNSANILNILGWFTSLTFITLSNNYLIFLIKKNKLVFFIIITLIIIILSLEFFNFYFTSKYSAKFFTIIFNNPKLGLSIMFLPIILYLINYKVLIKNFYLDSFTYLSKRRLKMVSKFNWIDNLWPSSPYIKNDLRLIIRNVKSRQYALISLTFLLYGITLFNFEQIVLKYPIKLIFTSTLMTGGFLFSFGQLIPSWDSSYYKMLMCQGIKYRNYLQSKLNILSLSVLIFFILSIPYIFLEIALFKIILSSAIFNIGITVPLTLLTGALNRKSIDLNTNIQAFETNEFNSIQVLFVFIKLALPILIFYPIYKIFNFEVGLLFLGMVGIIGYIFRNYSLDFIEKTYKKQKYNTIKSFSEKE